MDTQAHDPCLANRVPSPPSRERAYDAERMNVDAYHHTKTRIVVGRLVLARGELRFGSLVANARLEVALPLHEIASVRATRAASISTNAIVVEDRRGARFVFEVRDPAATVLALEAAVAATRGGAYR